VFKLELKSPKEERFGSGSSKIALGDLARLVPNEDDKAEEAAQQESRDQPEAAEPISRQRGNTSMRSGSAGGQWGSPRGGGGKRKRQNSNGSNWRAHAKAVPEVESESAPGLENWSGPPDEREHHESRDLDAEAEPEPEMEQEVDPEQTSEPALENCRETQATGETEAEAEAEAESGLMESEADSTERGTEGTRKRAPELRRESEAQAEPEIDLDPRRRLTSA
jgi:hypothetical protein